MGRLSFWEKEACQVKGERDFALISSALCIEMYNVQSVEMAHTCILGTGFDDAKDSEPF